jgi:hypothetical protein
MTGAYDDILQEIGRLKERLERCERENAELKAVRASRQPARPAIARNGNVICFPGVTLQSVKRRQRRKAVSHETR